MKTNADAQVEKGKGRPRIRPEIFEDDTAREAIACMYKEVRIAYPPSEYGHKATWRKSMVSVTDVMHKLSADHAKQSGHDRLLEKLSKAELEKAQPLHSTS